MPTQIVNSERWFKIWHYGVSHSLLLLRSPKSSNVPTHIDLLFQVVWEFHLPISFSGLIQEASDDEIRNLCILCQLFDPVAKVYVVKGTVRGTEFIGYIVARTCLCHEDEGESNEPSFFGNY